MDGDYDVDIFDIVRMAGGYGTEPPDPRYDPQCDIDDDLDIDIFDIVIPGGNHRKIGSNTLTAAVPNRRSMQSEI